MNNDRSKGRELALKFLYHKNLPLELDSNEDLGKENLDDDLALFLESYQIEDDEHPHNKLNDHSIFFGKKLVTGVLNGLPSLYQTIENNIGDWKLEKLERMDRCLLLVGAFELNDGETPAQVVINECINLAKSYGADKSYRFINGVLDGINNSN